MKIDAVEGVIIVAVVLATGVVIYFAVSSGGATTPTKKIDETKVSGRAVSNSGPDIIGGVKAVAQIVTEGTKIFSQLSGIFGGGSGGPATVGQGMNGFDSPDNYG